eukprot:gene35635-35567_t
MFAVGDIGLEAVILGIPALGGEDVADVGAEVVARRELLEVIIGDKYPELAPCAATQQEAPPGDAK